MRVATQEAESGLRQLNARAREYRGGRLGESQYNQPTFMSVGVTYRDANALVDIVAIAESYCVALLDSLDPAQQTGTWENRRRAWKKLGVTLGDCYDWDRLMGFVEARNAIQHGLGRLTDRQLSEHKKQILAQLDAASIHRSGDLIFVERRDVENLIQTCGNFIRWLDSRH